MNQLQFELTTIDNALRRGTLNFTNKNKIIQTPACIAYTLRGSVPHLIADNLKLLPVDMVHVALEHFVEQKEPPSFKYPQGLHRYINLPDHLIFCDVRDASKLAPVAANTEKYVAVDTHGGVRRVTTDLWKQAITAYKPDWCATPADVVKAGEDIKTKRIKKSVDRTLRWLDDCLASSATDNTPVFGPVVGFHNQEERVRSATETAQREQLAGFVLNAFELDKDVRMDLLKTSLDHLPVNKPRLAYGLSTPESILQGVAQGIDLFDGSYAYKMTERGRAITFKFGEHMSAPKEGEKPEKSLNLWDTQLAQNFDTLDSSCGCYTCTTPHTKAYIHHLLNAHEMLGPLLLMMHNVYQLEEFMSAIRKSMENKTFATDTDAFMIKYNHDKEGSGMEGHEDEIDFESLGSPIKKNRIL
ncbi:tRNA-guanine(15) transglycosylase-like protein [Phascolomyces articulosus]|uniref:Queuine tRNA-ribosyltransferase accessory subunit 2 n=1 Tax=Phascolomyces articulosus TaxID=60185 RepID=A0AAD5K952_9FUNG|nr:tRNA-guanine(15) transglycosylase-like protein [Phascolomyces articulosus]